VFSKVVSISVTVGGTYVYHWTFKRSTRFCQSLLAILLVFLEKMQKEGSTDRR